MIARVEPVQEFRDEAYHNKDGAEPLDKKKALYHRYVDINGDLTEDLDSLLQSDYFKKEINIDAKSTSKIGAIEDGISELIHILSNDDQSPTPEDLINRLEKLKKKILESLGGQAL